MRESAKVLRMVFLKISPLKTERVLSYNEFTERGAPVCRPVKFTWEVITMKRIQSACICQTLRFMLKEDAEKAWAAQQVKTEVEHYKKTLERNHIKYRIVEESEQPDGSVIVKIIKQYNQSPVGNYLD